MSLYKFCVPYYQSTNVGSLFVIFVERTETITTLKVLLPLSYNINIPSYLSICSGTYLSRYIEDAMNLIHSLKCLNFGTERV